MLKINILDSAFQAPLVSSRYPDGIHGVQSDLSHDFSWTAKLNDFFFSSAYQGVL